MVFPATFLWMSQSDHLWSKSCSKTMSVICVNNGQSMPSAWALKSRKGIAAISPTLCYVSGFNCVCPCEGRQGIMYTWLSCISLSEGVCFVCFQRKQWNTDTNSISSTENPMSFTYVSSGHSERLGVEVVSSAGFLPYRPFFSLFKCRNVFYEVYWQENLTLKLKATNMGSEE